MANKYTGEKCIACGEPFKEGDESDMLTNWAADPDIQLE